MVRSSAIHVRIADDVTVFGDVGDDDGAGERGGSIKPRFKMIERALPIAAPMHPVLLTTRFLIAAVSEVVTWMLPFRCTNLGSPARAMRVE